MSHRDNVKRRLNKTRARLRKLFKWEKRRDRVTERRRKRYRTLRERHGEKDPRTVNALKDYRASRARSIKIDETEEVLRKRAEKKVEFLREHPAPVDPDHDGLILIDGKQVAKGVGQEVLRIRKAGRWKGVVVSGYRSPSFSTSLCFKMCGQAQCPGRCAGTASRHAQKEGRNGAVDLSDFVTFANETVRLNSWLENHLPNDRVHFSDVGN